jgi:hypothetical protein
MWILLFGGPLAVLVTLGDNVGQTTFGGTPVSLIAAITLLVVILRRALVMRSVPLIGTPSSRTLHTFRALSV